MSGTPQPIPFRDALRFWLKLGLISFGGPAGQIAIMHQELVDRRRWISERRFLHALNYCMVLPGPEAQQLATYLGWLMHRTWGGIVAGALFVLPSLLLLMALAWIYLSFGETPLVAGLFYGIKPAVAALVLHAAWRIGSRTLDNRWLWLIAATAFVAIAVLSLPFPLILILAGITGWLGGRLAPQQFHAHHGGHAATRRQALPALIDDNTPVPPHARFQRQRLVKVLVAGALLWSLPMLVLTLGLGTGHVLTAMSWFFTKAALLTFGGAYAVLPYVYQGAVVNHGWVTPGQMMDGLALGETTPGPLIMVVAFVAFIGGYVSPAFGPEQALLGGVAAALLVTWFTFLPSFLFILAGGPLVESTRDELRLSAPLTAITAAVVGVILSLALFFGQHVLWPTGFADGPDWVAAAITVAAGVALFVFQRGVMTVIAGCAVAGLGYQLLGLS